MMLVTQHVIQLAIRPVFMMHAILRASTQIATLPATRRAIAIAHVTALAIVRVSAVSSTRTAWMGRGATTHDR